MHTKTNEKGMSTPLIVVLVVVAIGLIAYFATSQPADDAMTDARGSDDMTTMEGEMTDEMMDEGEVADEMGDEDMMEDEAGTGAETAVTEPPAGAALLAAGSYEEYSAEKVANADGDVVLFFHADWCPSCRGLEADINASLGDIPADVTILKVDYDAATELRQQYAVRQQHTLVHVDGNGEAIKTLVGTNSTLEDVLAQL